MQPPRRRDERLREERLLPRLERAFGQLNPALLAIAMGLVVLNLTCIAALLIPVGHLAVCAAPPTAAAQSK